MPISAKSARIGGALLIAFLMVAVGYVLPGFRFPETKPVNAELTDELLASYVSKDTDADGLPDWQEVLYGTDSNVADTDGDGISDGEAVRRGLLTPTNLSSQLPENPIGEEDIPGEPPAPGSLTDRFARSFFESYMRVSNGAPLSPEAQEELVTKLLGEFTVTAARSLESQYTLVSIRTDATRSISSYAGELERTLDAEIPDSPDSDMGELARKYIEENDESARERLAELGRQYSSGAAAALSMSVPPALASNHLKLVQGLDQAGRAATALSEYEQDPLLTLGAIAVLAPARGSIMQGLTGIAEAILAGGEPAPGAPGFLIVRLIRYEQQQ